MRWTPWFVAAAVGGLVASAPFELEIAQAGSRTHRPDVLTVDQIKPGMKGYGLTVFEGTKPEKFGVEIIDVIKNFRPRQDAILIKTLHPRLDVVNVVRGMSGSPIYIDGKMIGAYAYGWSFGKEPVAGVTPIESMLEDLERPLPKSIFGWPLDPLSSPQKPAPAKAAAKPEARLDAFDNPNTRFTGNVTDYHLDDHAAELRERSPLGKLSAASGGLRPVATPILLGGMGEAASSLARELLEPLGLEPQQGGGGGAPDPNAPLHYEDGGAIAVQLISGDLSATGLGTVTRVEGDRLVAFGHPMMGGGVTSLPTAVGKVSWFLASEAASFKLGTAVRPLGALVNDRQASIVVSESAKAPLVPVSVHIDGAPGAPYRDWNFEVAHEKFMTPSFLAMAIGEALQATAAERQDISWTAESKVKIKGQPEITLEDFGVSIGGTPDPREFVRSHLVSSVGGVLNNPWEPALVESIAVRIKLDYARDIVRLREARAVETEVDAGQPVNIVLTLIPFAGPPVTRTISVPIPKYLAGSTLKLAIRPGHSVPREKANPETLSEFVANLEDPIYPPKSVVVSYAAGGGVAFKGRVAENLPPGALDSIRQRTASFSPEAFKSNRYHVVELEDFMVGSDSVSVKVRPILR
ncbi:MAG TPA: SpoIVB peptidase S55 domain-containing protein [Polyangiaceae bacterium]|nr:SpoIVB peptidase S55 domain-containing protein [Polyangiaceae bacterium]